jgi:hypothetical protein
MKEIAVICSFALLGACSSSNVKINRTTATVQTTSRSEPIFYNGKTYDMKVSGLSPKQQQDAVNIATSALSYFACPDGQRGKIIGLPIYVGKKWTAYGRCG